MLGISASMSRSLLAAAVSLLVLLIARMLQNYIFLGRRPSPTENRRYETTLVGLNLLLVVLGQYLASIPTLTLALAGNDTDRGQGTALVLSGALILIICVFGCASAVANPRRTVYPVPSGSAVLLRDAINLLGAVVLGLYVLVLLGLNATLRQDMASRIGGMR